MDQLDQLFAHAIPIWDSRVDEARAAGADISGLVAIVMLAGDQVRTALCERELAAARIEAHCAPTPIGLAGDIRRATTPIAVAVIREPNGSIRAETRPLVILDDRRPS